MKTPKSILSLLLGILFLSRVIRPSECWAEQGVSGYPKGRVALSQEEVNLIQNLALLENLEYLEDADVDLLANYDAIEEDADDTQNNE